MADRDYMFRNGLGFEYSGGEYRKLIDVRQKRYPLWALACTGQYLALVHQSECVLVVLSLKRGEYRVGFLLHTDECT